MTGVERVLDGALLNARLWLPDRNTTALYVTFRPYQPDPGQFDESGPVQRALTAGLAHLHIQTRWNDWYLNAETPALEAALKSVRQQFMTARALGYSMGGYAALRLSRALRLNQVLLISPQLSLLLPEEDRYPEAAGFDAAAGDLASHARPALSGVVVYDPTHRLDRLHAEGIIAVLPDIQPAKLCFGGHPGSAALGHARGFRALQRLSLSSRLQAREIVQLHRDLRRTSARYWRERADRLLRRGREDLAAQALDRAEALTGLAPNG